MSTLGLITPTRFEDIRFWIGIWSLRASNLLIVGAGIYAALAILGYVLRLTDTIIGPLALALSMAVLSILAYIGAALIFRTLRHLFPAVYPNPNARPCSPT